ncbi:unnamed protein product [Miscanthus lutarioriparius]|uniref:Uncharacterized protein n=1 Tax=Miscanthus lutarioriparius TaxID=422564 RepID=A0A811PAX6_9POAL|nr:unnamed protein product [Miscanthus lutarioriparius]
MVRRPAFSHSRHPALPACPVPFSASSRLRVRLETAAIGRFPAAARPLPPLSARPPHHRRPSWCRGRAIAASPSSTPAPSPPHSPVWGVAALRQSAGAGCDKQLAGSAGGHPVSRAPCAALTWPLLLAFSCSEMDILYQSFCRTRAGISRADQYYASYPAGTELLTDTAKLYKAALGNCFEIDEWGPIEFSIMAKHFDRQGNHHTPTML